VGVGRASLVGALEEHFNIQARKIAQIVAPEAIYRDKSLAGIYRALWERAWTPLLETELRIIEFIPPPEFGPKGQSAFGGYSGGGITQAGREAQGRKIYVTLADLVERLRIEAETFKAQSRSA